MKKEIQITGYRCKQCGRVHYPFHERCINCKAREFEQVKPEGQARLLAYTQIFNLPWGFDNRFLVIGVVEFENCLKAMGQIHVDSLDQIKTGMTLTPKWDVVRVITGEKVYGLVLEP